MKRKAGNKSISHRELSLLVKAVWSVQVRWLFADLTYPSRQVQLAVRAEGHVDVAGFCRAVDLNRSVNLVKFGLGFRVDHAVFGAKASEDIQRLVAISRLEEPSRRFCKRSKSQRSRWRKSIRNKAKYVPGMKKVQIARPSRGL